MHRATARGNPVRVTLGGSPSGWLEYLLGRSFSDVHFAHICRPGSGVQRKLRRTLKIVFELLLARLALFRPCNILEAELGRRMQRPRRIGQVRARQRTQVGATGGDDGVDVVGLENIADGNGRYIQLIADTVENGT